MFLIEKIKCLFQTDDTVTLENSNRENYSKRFYAAENLETQNEIKKCGIKGIVTFIDVDMNGRIDGYINFDRSSIITYKCPEKKITIGSEVEMEIERNSNISPWFAKKFVVLSSTEIQSNDWDDNSEMNNNDKTDVCDEVENLPLKLVGMVTYVYNQEIIVNNDINFRQSDCGENSFRPFEGDWVIIQFDHSVRIKKVVGIWPLRYVDFEGCVSSFNGNVGYIDKVIFFNKSVTRNDYFRRGNFVYGTAIESVQGRRCNFRAVSIFKQTNDGANRSLNMRVKTVNLKTNVLNNPQTVGLELSCNIVDFGELDITESSIKTVVITNTNEVAVKILSIKLSSETNDQFILENNIEEFELLSQSSITLTVKCSPQFPGYDSQKIFIEGIDSSDKKWTLLIDVSVYIFDSDANKLSTIESKVLQPNKTITNVSQTETSGVHLPAAKPLKISSVLTKMYPHNLKMYPVPKELEDKVENKDDIVGIYPFLGESLNPGNYANKMNILVHLEEINTKEEMKQFVLEDVRLLPRRDTFCIEVPGLSEGRPSLMLGDKVVIKISESHGSTYSGNIEEILCESIFVKFHPIFHSTYSNEVCCVTFQHSRLPFRRMHLGIEMARGNLGDNIVFPRAVEKKTSQCVRLSRSGVNEFSAANFTKAEQLNLLQLKFYNETLNELQRVAVLRILHGYCRPLPYILFGPPGTGKTVTLVETILQVYKNVPSSRILLCAPSNSASDLLCLRLHESGVINTGEMVRMNAYRRTILSEMSDKEPIPPKILPYCKSVDELAEIAMYRIIISTCISSGSLYRLGLKAGHISHVFVDEAGQASEPEIMVSLGLISKESGQIVLAGDPMQLGPVIRSPLAEQLQESYLHRLLLSSELYKKQKDIFPGSCNHYNPIVVTQLLDNYRAHPALLKLSSEMFYDSSLVSRVARTRFIGWKWLPNPQVPLVFNGVRGKELRNSRNPSTYNPSEAVMVIRWIGRLLQDSEKIGVLEHSQISVITPYRAQVDSIRKMIKTCLPDVNLAKLKVASVEEFQGQENEVVIISTVRSSLDDSGAGAIESCSLINTVGSRLGFLSNKRRFNVSITRACSLLIVVGDPALLRYDECWSSLIDYAKEQGAFCGSE